MENDLITNNNTHGFKAAAGYNDSGDLVYEASIPLSMLNIPLDNSDKWAFNIKINGISKPNFNKEGTDLAEGGRRGGGGRGMGGGRQRMHKNTESDFSVLSKSTDFWQILYYR